MSEYTLMLEIEMEGLKADLAEARAQIAAKDSALKGIWDWWYGEKRGKATPEEFAAFLEGMK